MDAKMLGASSCTQRLSNLAQQLNLYNSKASFSSISRNNASFSNKDESGESNHISKHSSRAAVLICLFEGDDGDLHVILTKRASTLSSHSGEVVLPGGKTDEDDADDVATALREAKEEIGLDSSLVHVAAVLEPFVMKHGMTVVPVIGLLLDKNAFRPNPNPAEVELVFDAPLEIFLKNENRREEEREWMGEKYLIHFFDHEAENQKHVIFAFTAGILIRAASIVYQKSPAFTERMPTFWAKPR